MLQQLYDSVFSQPSGFLFWNESLLLGYLCTTVGSPVQRSISMFVDVSLNNSWDTDMCSLLGDGGEKSSHRRFLFCAQGVVSCSTTPYRLLSLGTVFVKFDTISCAHPCSVQSTATNCPAPTRRATTPLRRPEQAAGNSSDPELTSDCFTAGYSGFCSTALLQLWTV